MKSVIISIEWTFTSLEITIIISDMGKIYTYRTESIRNQNLMIEIINNLVENNTEKIIALFKERYSLLHCGITLSLGPTLRRKITKRRKNKNEEN